MKLKKPRFWDQKKPNLYAFLFYPLAIFIQLLNSLKNKVTKNNFKIKTICLGNIYIGGTGKTSLCITLKKILNKDKPDYLIVHLITSIPILLFTLNRKNIWPVQDIGLLRAISNNYNKKYLPPEKFVNYLKLKFSPYCSVATWYLWRSIDDEPIQY